MSSIRILPVCIVALTLLADSGAWGQGLKRPPAGRLHAERPAGHLAWPVPGVDGTPVLVLDGAALRQAADGPGPFVIEDFPLGYGVFVDLRLERFRVTTPSTQFVSGGGPGLGAPIAFDPEEIVLLRGTVLGHAGSRAYLAISEWGSNGIVDLGPGRAHYALSWKTPAGAPLPNGQLAVAQAAQSGPNPAEHCMHWEDELDPPPDPKPASPDAVKGLRQIELAVETDHEFFLLFPSEPAAAAYVVQLYGAVSVIFMQEINTRVDLTFVRIWPQPNEPFNAGLNQFQGYWSGQMQSVHRDVAQMYSGIPSLPGGVAWLSSLCDGGAYSFCGNATGFFFASSPPNVYNYDPLVTAHELGHNFGTGHTDSYGLDNCNTVQATPQRGTIMSYCNQTVSGGMGVIDMRFHKVTQQKMRDFIATVTNTTCVVFDCNQNGLGDHLDIASGFSTDANGNGIPDECEDCNTNGVLDPQDIASGASLDLNSNSIPDECEPDCNSNNVPDDRDIALGTSQDFNADNIPDECEADCNTNGVSDYREITTNMPLDKDRNIVLDSCQDCDNDGTPDLVELEGADSAWLASATGGVIREYHAIMGVHIKASTGTTLGAVQDVRITPDRRVLVTSAGDSRVAEFNRLGAFVQNLVPPGGGTLSNPAGMVISPAGTLLVASRGNNSVRQYNLATGAFISVFASGGGLSAPFGLAFGPDGHLYVTSGSAAGSVLRFNGATGAFMNVFVAAGAGGLNAPRGILFKPDGNLLACSYGSDRVLEYGTNGAFIGPWNQAGPNFLPGPWAIRLGRNGNVYVSQNILTETHVTKPRINEFHIDDGRWLRAYVLAEDSLISQPTGFDWMPGDATDCNRNQMPDSCDIASGFSHDHNNNGRPDECECYADCNGDGQRTVADFGCFQTEFATGDPYADCNGDGQLTVGDFGCFQTRFVTGCP